MFRELKKQHTAQHLVQFYIQCACTYVLQCRLVVQSVLFLFFSSGRPHLQSPVCSARSNFGA